MSEVLASIVTYNDEPFLARCLDSLFAQTVPVRVKVFDNASRDGSAEVARAAGARVFVSPRNLGYAAGHNRNLQGEAFTHALLLNADVILDSRFLERLLEAMEALPRAGMAGGKLYRMDVAGRPLKRHGRPLLDSTGIYFTPAQRHLDRGSLQEDRGQYERRERVFGITGAACLCRREMLEEVRDEGQILDEDFFAYREDADLAWRARWLGWEALYEPRAQGWHRRRVLPRGRRRVAREINYHSLKNRYLLRMKNMDTALRRRCFPHMWLRDAGILAWVLALEQSSLGAYREAWRLRRRFREKHRRLMARRRVTGSELAEWFAFRPVAKGVE